MNDKDELIRKLVRQKGVEKAPPDFTDNIMSKLDPEMDTSDDRIFSKIQWGLIFGGVVAAIVIVFFLDIPFFDTIFSMDRISNIQLGSLGPQITQYISSIFSDFKMSSLSIMVVAAILLLLGIDRVLRFRQSQTHVF